MSVQPAQTVELALVTYLDGIAVSNGRAALATTHLSTALQDQVTQHGAVIHVKQTGGTTAALAANPRVGIDVFAATYTDVWAVAHTINGLLLRPFFRAGEWLIDYCENEAAPSEQAHANLRRVTSVWRLAVRPATP